MPITVRVKNFQSIEDATVVLDGFAVVTGPNNSGKTALMRAIRGVFTNAPAGPLVRHGTDYLTVELDFGDGNVVRWEKGWERPDQKGKTVNRYFINGVSLGDAVGRGCPDEVLALGVKPIKAGTETLWPQVADQFKGTLFLVGSTGSVVAEAIANVDRVGQLSQALKLSESDRRSVTSTLKVRRKDQDTLTAELETFDGLDGVGKKVDVVGAALDTALEVQDEVRIMAELQDRVAHSRETVDGLAGIAEVHVPPADPAIHQAGIDLMVASGLRHQQNAHQSRITTLAGIEDMAVPTAEVFIEADSIRGELREARALESRWTQADAAVLSAEAATKAAEDITFTSIDHAGKIKSALSFCQTQQDRIADLQATLTSLEQSEASTGAELEAAQAEVREILGGLDECPTCGQGMDHIHGGAA